MEELVDKANYYTNMEEEFDLPDLKRKISQVDQTQEWNTRVKKKSGSHKRTTNNYAVTRVPRIEFTILPQEFLLKFKDDPNFKWLPASKKSFENQDKSNYC